MKNNGKIDPNSTLGKLLIANSDWAAMSEQQKDTWVKDFETSVKEGFTWLLGEGSSR
ncbi:MAG: hypothetical protein IJD46_01135 [Bacilli bacterium]|nr:hypothetical protein [Bacilli bacterium]